MNIKNYNFTFLQSSEIILPPLIKLRYGDCTGNYRKVCQYKVSTFRQREGAILEDIKSPSGALDSLTIAFKKQ